MLVGGVACSGSNQEIENRAIEELGVYSFNGGIKIIVYRENYLLRYLMLDGANNTLLKSDKNISLMQKWGLYLDRDDQLWVLSSDIGHSCWVKNDTTGSYRNKVFSGKLDKSSLPKGLISAFGDLIIN